MKVDDFIIKSQDGGSFAKEDLLEMLGYPPDSATTYRIMAEANRISKELTGNRAEVHAQLALNLAPCACNCIFCSLRDQWGFFIRKRGSPEEAVASAGNWKQTGQRGLSYDHGSLPLWCLSGYFTGGGGP